MARYDPPRKPLATQTVTGGGYDPPDDPGAGAAMQVERPRKPFVAQTGAGGRYDPPDEPGSGAAAVQTERPRKPSQAQIGSVARYDPPSEVEMISGGGPPPPPPGAGAIMIPAYAAGPAPVGLEIASHQGPPGDPYDAAFL